MWPSRRGRTIRSRSSWREPHRIVRLEDIDGDGSFDTSIVFADRMMFPEGRMFLDGSLYVSAPPSIWKLTDTDGDGVADERASGSQGKTLTGCANDLHGPYSGRMVGSTGARGRSPSRRTSDPARAAGDAGVAHLSLPAGRHGFEPVMTGGMDNPVDVVFTPEGERIFSATFLRDPAAGCATG